MIIIFFKEWYQATGSENNSKDIPSSIRLKSCLEQEFEFNARTAFLYSKEIKNVELDLSSLECPTESNDLDYFSSKNKIRYGADQKTSYFKENLNLWHLDRLNTLIHF